MENQFLDTEFEEPRQYLQYAGFWERFVAALIDSIILGIPGVALMYLFGYSFENIIEEAKDKNLEAFRTWRYFMVVVLGVVINWLYHALQESGEYQATLGKRALYLKVTDLDGRKISFEQASMRFWVKHLISSGSDYTKFLSSAEFSTMFAVLTLANYLMQPFTERRQTLHDIIARTLVYKND
jgi:uncharacterized RDD family membrane protein YckC